MRSIPRRPDDFFGPEDYDGTEDWEVTEAKIREAQADWDLMFSALPWWRRLLFNFFG